MRQFFILAILSLGFSLSISAQNNYSTLTFKETRTNLKTNFELNNKLYNVGNEFSNYIENSSIVISEIENDGNVSVVKRLDYNRLGEYSVLAEDNELIIVSTLDSSVYLSQYDDSFNIVQKLVINDLPNISEHIRVSKLLSSDDYYYLFGEETKSVPNPGEDAFIIRVDKTDFSKVKFEIIPPNMIQNNLYDAEILNDSTIIVIAQEQINDFEYLIRFDFYDLELNKNKTFLTDIVASNGWRHDLEIINEQLIINQRYPYNALISLDLDGNLNWELEIDNIFEEYGTDDVIINKISIDSNEDIVILGSVNRLADLYGFNGYIMKATTNGDLEWARIYLEGVDNYLLNTTLRDWTETTDGYIFTGHDSYYPVIPDYNYAWVLKTDFNGCISDTTCSDFQLVDTEELPNKNVDAFDLIMNPVQDNIQINIKSSSTNYITLIDNNGLIVSTYNNLSLGKHTMDITNFSTGIYYLKVEIAGKRSQIEKVVILGGG